MARIPQVIAHRGYGQHYPENTLPALEAALRAGADGVELDVQLTRDGVPVVFHDADLLRTTGEHGNIFDRELADLRGLSAGEPQRLGDAFVGTPIPTLAEAADMLRRYPDARVFVEIKRDSIPHHQIPQAVSAVLDSCRGLGHQLVVISFDEGVLREARSLEPGVAIGWVLAGWGTAALERAELLEPEYLFCSHRRLPAAPAALWPGPWRWVIYEINDPYAAQALAERGAHAIETIAVEQMVRALTR